MSGPQSRTTVARPVGLLGVVVGALLVVAVTVWANLVSGVDPSQPPGSPVAAEPSSIKSNAPTTSDNLPQTQEPAPTTAGDVLWVEPNLVDRPGVPASLYDKYWVGGGQAGHVGTTARIILPEDEEILGADAGRVASFAISPETSRPLVGPNGAEIIVRDIRTGTTLRVIDTPVHLASGLLAGRLLFWTGRTLPSDAPDSTDAGLWVIDLDLPDSSPQAVIPPSDLAERYGSDAIRGAIRLTDNGRTALTLIQSPTARATDLIDVESLTLRHTLMDSFAAEVVNEVALVIPLHGDTGQASQRMRLINLATGDAVGPDIATRDVGWAVTGTGEIYVQHGIGGTGFSIIAIDAATGDARELVAQTSLVLSHELSATDVLVLMDLSWDIGADGKAIQPITLLDPQTGHLQADAFTIGNP